jgi:hypothetical protein
LAVATMVFEVRRGEGRRVGDWLRDPVWLDSTVLMELKRPSD